jgi:rod shape-determining protein MreD
VLAGLVLGPTEGAWVGFATGLVADLSLPTSFGLSALVLTLTGFAVGSIVAALIEGPWWVVPLVGAFGTAIGELLHVAVATITGQDLVLHQATALIDVVAVASAANAVLAIPVAVGLRWAAGPAELPGAKVA